MTIRGLARIAACLFCTTMINPLIGSRHRVVGSLLWPMVIIFAVSMVIGEHSVFAQLRIVGSISGTIQDPNGAVIAKAKVALRDEKTGITRESKSNDDGTFLLPDLAIGLYEVTVSAPGFQTYVMPNISVSTNQTTDIKIRLEVGAASETITVEGSAEQSLETSSQLVASTIGTRTVTELPVANRSNVLALARLAPGASPPTGGDTRYNNLPGGAVNVTVDGINDASNGFKSGGPGVPGFQGNASPAPCSATIHVGCRRSNCPYKALAVSGRIQLMVRAKVWSA